MKLFKDWKEKAILETQRELTQSILNAEKELGKEIRKMGLTAQIKVRVINCLRKKPVYILGTTSILVRSDNHKLAHDVAKELGITLKKVAESDGFNYKGEYKGISIIIYGMKQAAKCRVVSHKELREVDVYETVCK